LSDSNDRGSDSKDRNSNSDDHDNDDDNDNNNDNDDKKYTKRVLIYLQNYWVSFLCKYSTLIH
jgi:hypothetical protein